MTCAARRTSGTVTTACLIDAYTCLCAFISVCTAWCVTQRALQPVCAVAEAPRLLLLCRVECAVDTAHHSVHALRGARVLFPSHPSPPCIPLLPSSIHFPCILSYSSFIP
jgi:hypothetical protein